MNITNTIRNTIIGFGAAATIGAINYTLQKLDKIDHIHEVDQVSGIMLPAEGVCFQTRTSGTGSERTYIFEINGADGRYFADVEAFKKPVMTLEASRWTTETPSITKIVSAPTGSRLHDLTEADVKTLKTAADGYASRGAQRVDCTARYHTL